jgi:hypothetical protein
MTQWQIRLIRRINFFELIDDADNPIACMSSITVLSAIK